MDLVEASRLAAGVARETLEAQGVTDLPSQGVEFIEEDVWWSYWMVWFMVGMASMAVSMLLVRDEPPMAPLRFADDILAVRMAHSNASLVLFCFPTFVLLMLVGRTAAGFVHSNAALHYMGESLILLPKFGQALIRWARRAGNSWPAVRRRWMLQLWAVVALQVLIHVAVLYRLRETYTAVFYGGVRETWPGHYQEYPWEDLREIRPWCNERRHAVLYELRFRGETFNLLRVDRRGLSYVNSIDRALVGMGKPKLRHTPASAQRCAALWKATLWKKDEERPIIEEIFKR